jgi:cob(I)alamin adenosyltransferase
MPAARRPSARSITTRTGDDGSTGLLYGQRVPKNHPQIEAVGALDELNAALGFAKATIPGGRRRPGADAATLAAIQRELIALMGEITCAERDQARYAKSAFAKLGDDALARVDATAAAVEARQPKFDGWATPGANLHAAAIDLARTAARRAERHLVGLPAHGKTVRPLLVRYLNRVSDLLWLLAREAESG